MSNNINNTGGPTLLWIVLIVPVIVPIIYLIDQVIRQCFCQPNNQVVSFEASSETSSGANDVESGLQLVNALRAYNTGYPQPADREVSIMASISEEDEVLEEAHVNSTDAVAYQLSRSTAHENIQESGSMSL